MFSPTHNRYPLSYAVLNHRARSSAVDWNNESVWIPIPSMIPLMIHLIPLMIPGRPTWLAGSAVWPEATPSDGSGAAAAHVALRHRSPLPVTGRRTVTSLIHRRRRS